MKFRSLSLLLLALFTLVASPARVLALTDAEATAGRALVKRYADTIVHVELVVTIKMTMGERTMPPREQKREVNGTVISSTGLTVISLGEIDPRAAIAAQPNVRMEDPDYKEVKLRLADGSEIPASIVLKDPDQDLAFVVPLGPPGRTFSFVKLEDAAEPTLLATYYNIARTSKQQQRTPLVIPLAVVGLIEKPRRLILANSYAVSCPVFDAEGKVLGICLRNISGGQQAGIVIVPAADIADIAKQAAAIKPESPAEAVPDIPVKPAAPAAEKAP